MTVLREWCRAQQAATTARFPGSRALLARAEGASAPVVGIVCLLLLLVVQLTTSHGDAAIFAEAGDRLVHGHVDVFRDSTLQVGPLYLLLVGPGASLADLVGVPQWAGAAVLTSAMSTALLLAALGALAGPAPRAGRRLLGGLTVLLGGAMVVPATYGHPEEVLTALLLVLGTATARRGGTWAPALLLAAAMTTKLWAVVGVGLLLVAADRRLALKRGAVVALAFGAVYLPFLALDRVATFDMVWQVERPAPLSLLLDDGSAFGYRQRLLQVALAAAVGVLLARRARGLDVVWALPLGVMSLRLLLDPLSNPYYWTTLVVLVLLRLVVWEGALLESALLGYLGNIAMLLVIVTAQGRLGAAAMAALGVGGLLLAFSAVRATASSHGGGPRPAEASPAADPTGMPPHVPAGA